MYVVCFLFLSGTNTGTTCLASTHPRCRWCQSEPDWLAGTRDVQPPASTEWLSWPPSRGSDLLGGTQQLTKNLPPTSRAFEREKRQSRRRRRRLTLPLPRRAPGMWGSSDGPPTQTRPSPWRGTPTPLGVFVWPSQAEMLGRASARLRQLFPQQAGSTSPALASSTSAPLASSASAARCPFSMCARTCRQGVLRGPWHVDTARRRRRRRGTFNAAAVRKALIF